MHYFGAVSIGTSRVLCRETLNSWKESLSNRNETLSMETRLWGSCKTRREKRSSSRDSSREKRDPSGAETGSSLERGGGWVLRIEIDLLIKETRFTAHWWRTYDLISVVYRYGSWLRSRNRYLTVPKSAQNVCLEGCFYVTWRIFFQGCYSKHDPFKKEKPYWTAFRTLNYGFSQMTIFNKTHIGIQQVDVDLVGAWKEETQGISSLGFFS